MKTKDEIVANYTGTPLKEFGKHILLVNFTDYVRLLEGRKRLAPIE